MGISDDIKPTKKGEIVQSISIHTEATPEPETNKEKEFDVKSFLSKETDKLSDDFFNNSKKTEKSSDTPNTSIESNQPDSLKKSKGFDKRFLWLILIPILAFFIYQNYKDIKTSLKKAPATTTNNNNNSKTYTGEIIPQDYTTTEPTNANTNATAANTNTAPADVATPAVNANTNTTIAPATTAITKSSIKIKVLNGNGISGSGDAIKKQLIAAGFTVSNTGNASNFNYTNSKIYYKTGKSEQAQMVKDAITTKTATLTLSDSVAGAYDVVFVVGKN